MRAGAELGAFLDVEVHDVAGLQFVAERDPQPIPVGVDEHPPPGRGHLFDRFGADELVPLGGDLLLDPRTSVDDRAGDRPPGQLAGDPPRLGRRHRVDGRNQKPVAVIGKFVLGGPVRCDLDPVGRPAVVAQGQHGDSGPAVDRETGPLPGEVHHHDPRPAWGGVGGVRTAGGQIGESVGAGEHHPRLSRSVDLRRVLGMGKPLQELPVRILRIVDEHPDLQQIRRVEHRQVADDGPHQRGRPGRITADRDGRKRPKLNKFRAVVHQSVGPQELGQPHVTDRFEVGLGGRLRAGQFPPDGRLEQAVDRRLRADPDAGGGVELGVGRA